MHASHQQDKQRTKSLSIVTNNQQIRSFSNKIAGCCPGNRWLDNNQRLPEIRLGPSRICPNNIPHTHGQLPYAFWPCSSVGGAAVILSKGRGFKSHPGQGFSLSLCGPNSNTRVDP